MTWSSVSIDAKPSHRCRLETVSFVGQDALASCIDRELVTRFLPPEPQQGNGLLIGGSTTSGCHARVAPDASFGVRPGTLPVRGHRPAIAFAAAVGDGRRGYAAVSRVGLTQLVAHLPHGVDTAVHERGVSLSSGERQLIRTGPRIPGQLRGRLDEATSNLDLKSEAQVEVGPTRCSRAWTPVQSSSPTGSQRRCVPIGSPSSTAGGFSLEGSLRTDRLVVVAGSMRRCNAPGNSSTRTGLSDVIPVFHRSGSCRAQPLCVSALNSRSAIRSAGSSIPTDSRMTSGPAPAAKRSSSTAADGSSTPDGGSGCACRRHWRGATKVHALHDANAGLEAAADAEGEHRPCTARQVARGQVVADGLDGRPAYDTQATAGCAVESYANTPRVRDVPFHPQWQGLDAGQDEEGVVGDRAGPRSRRATARAFSRTRSRRTSR